MGDKLERDFFHAHLVETLYCQCGLPLIIERIKGFLECEKRINEIGHDSKEKA